MKTVTVRKCRGAVAGMFTGGVLTVGLIVVYNVSYQPERTPMAPLIDIGHTGFGALIGALIGAKTATARTIRRGARFGAAVVSIPIVALLVGPWIAGELNVDALELLYLLATRTGFAVLWGGMVGTAGAAAGRERWLSQDGH